MSFFNATNKKPKITNIAVLAMHHYLMINPFVLLKFMQTDN